MRKLAASAAIIAATAGMALAGSATALAHTDNDNDHTWRHHHYYVDCSSPHAINVLTCVDVLDLSNLL